MDLRTAELRITASTANVLWTIVSQQKISHTAGYYFNVFMLHYCQSDCSIKRRNVHSDGFCTNLRHVICRFIADWLYTCASFCTDHVHRSLVSPYLVKTHQLELYQVYARSMLRELRALSLIHSREQKIPCWLVSSHAATSPNTYTGDYIDLDHRFSIIQGLIFHDSRLKREGFCPRHLAHTRG